MVGSCCILFPSVVLPSWALFCYPKFGGQSWKDPVIGHIFFLMDLINMGIYSSLKREAWKKNHKQRSYDTFSSVCTFAVPYFRIENELIILITNSYWVYHALLWRQLTMKIKQEWQRYQSEYFKSGQTCYLLYKT